MYICIKDKNKKRNVVVRIFIKYYLCNIKKR